MTDTIMLSSGASRFALVGPGLSSPRTVPYRGLGVPLWETAGAAPTLDLNFAQNRTLLDSVTGQNLVTFTRASAGTYVGSDGLIKTAANDVPRFDHNPTTGESLGLLVEEQRTNLLVRSEEFDNASWSASNVNITANTIAAPSGTPTGDTVGEDTSTGTHRLLQQISYISGTTYTASFYVKASGRDQFRIRVATQAIWPGEATFDLSNGTIISTTNGTAFIVSAGNGWYRCSVSAAATATGTTGTGVYLVSSGVLNYTGDGTSGIYLWGAQLEQGAFPTSYIPTTDAATTRAADVASITGSAFSSWYRQDEGTFSYQWKVPSATAPSNIFSVSDGTTSNRHQHYSESNSIFIRTASSGVASNNGVGTSSADTFTRVSYGYGSGTTSASDNGTAITTSTQTIPNNITTAYLGASANGVVSQAAILSRITYWPQRLPGTTLESITA